MTIKPILFSGPMVRALLDGRKTQTRRVVKTSPDWPSPHSVIVDKTRITKAAPVAMFRWQSGFRQDVKLPIARGDHLYVREAWRVEKLYDNTPPRDLSLDRRGSLIVYEAGGPEQFCEGQQGKFRQGMHMPRWASRIWLDVTDVRVQRLQDISDNDSLAEGICPTPLISILTLGTTGATGEHTFNGYTINPIVDDQEHEVFSAASEAYAELWDSLNGTPRKLSDGTLGPDISWDANPWVVCYDFKVHRGNIDKDVSNV